MVRMALDMTKHDRRVVGDGPSKRKGESKAWGLATYTCPSVRRSAHISSNCTGAKDAQMLSAQLVSP